MKIIKTAEKENIPSQILSLKDHRICQRYFAIYIVISGLACSDFFVFVMPDLHDKKIKNSKCSLFLLRFMFDYLLIVGSLCFYIFVFCYSGEDVSDKNIKVTENNENEIVEITVDDKNYDDKDESKNTVIKTSETSFKSAQNHSSCNDGDIQELITVLKNDKSDAKIIAATKIRKFLIETSKSKIEEYIKNGVVEIFVDCLNSRNVELQYEAALTLSYIATSFSSQIKAILDADGIPILLNLLDTVTNDDEISEHVLTILANIIADKQCHLEECLELGLTRSLSKKIITAKNSNICVRNVSKVYANIFCHPIILKEFNKLLPSYKKLLRHSDPLVLEQIFMALLNLTSHGKDGIQIVINNEFINEMISILKKHPKTTDDPVFENLHINALQIFANIFDGTTKQAQHLLNCGILRQIKEYLKFFNPKIVREATNFIGNILSETEKQIQAIIDAKILPILVSLLDHENSEIKNEAIWAFFNLAICGKPSQIMPLTTDKAFIFLLTENLQKSETKIVEAILLTFNFIFTNSNGTDLVNEFCQNLEDCGTMKKIKELQSQKNEEIKDIVNSVLDTLNTVNYSNDVAVKNTFKYAKIENFVF